MSGRDLWYIRIPFHYLLQSLIFVVISFIIHPQKLNYGQQSFLCRFRGDDREQQRRQWDVEQSVGIKKWVDLKSRELLEPPISE